MKFTFSTKCKIFFSKLALLVAVCLLFAACKGTDIIGRYSSPVYSAELHLTTDFDVLGQTVTQVPKPSFSQTNYFQVNADVQSVLNIYADSALEIHSIHQVNNFLDEVKLIRFADSSNMGDTLLKSLWAKGDSILSSIRRTEYNKNKIPE